MAVSLHAKITKKYHTKNVVQKQAICNKFQLKIKNEETSTFWRSGIRRRSVRFPCCSASNWVTHSCNPNSHAHATTQNQRSPFIRFTSAFGKRLSTSTAAASSEKNTHENVELTCKPMGVPSMQPKDASKNCKQKRVYRIRTR